MQMFLTPEEKIIEQLRTENAALKEQVAHWKNNHETEVRRARVLKERTDMPLERVHAYDKWGNDQETIAQQAERIVELNKECNSHYETCQQQAEAIRVSVELMQEVKSKYFALLKEKDTESDQFKAGGDMYGWNFHQGMRSGAVNMHIYMTKLIKHLAIQPSPDILQARDERVAEAITKYLRAVGVLSYEGTALQGIISGEWRKYL